jgi:DNA-binding GntR family transcriptional regulator
MAQATERAYAQIRSLLIAGDFEPGSRLREEDLAERTGVSRTPVREALRKLANEGFVEFQPRRGVQVTSWTDQDLDELFGVRALLESYGAGQAADRAGAEHIATMAGLCDRMDALAEQTYGLGHGNGDRGAGGDEAARVGASVPPRVQAVYHEIAELNNEFHETVLAAAGNTHLRSLMGGLISMPLVQRTFMRYSGDRLARSMSHHRELVDAIRSGDSVWASSVMNAHVRSARVELY